MTTPKIYLIPIIWFSIHISLFAQKHDNIWLFGYASEAGVDGFGGTVMEFTEDSLNLYYEYRDMNFDVTNASVSDEEGNLLFYTNGIYIADALGDTIENGGGINPGQYASDHSYLGYRLNQGLIILPKPDEPYIYYLIHASKQYPNGVDLNYHSDKLYYTVIDMTLNNEEGGVTEKNQIIIDQPMYSGTLTATKHANGRDWRLLMNEYDSNIFYRVLLTPDGIFGYEVQQIGEMIPRGLGQAVFSPDGSKYAKVSLFGGLGVGDQLSIYDFHRCTGLLSNPNQFIYADSAWSGGVAISPNSKYLYVSHYNYVFQFDLEADDVQASMDTVAIYDGFEEEGTNGLLYPTRFFMAQLGPDGKIYINCPGSLSYLHVINHPDSVGIACEVLQHHVHLPTKNNSSLPNFPNYRLGALEGSPCDTILEAPLAAFSCSPDTANSLSYQFLDESANDPDTWLWDFGDGTTSQEASPAHSFPGPGSYEVCLTVSNAVGQDSVCKMVVVMTDNVTDTHPDNRLILHPNPAKDNVYLMSQHTDSWDRVELLDVAGKVVLQNNNVRSISVASLPKGVYVVRSWSQGRAWSGILIRK